MFRHNPTVIPSNDDAPPPYIAGDSQNNAKRTSFVEPLPEYTPRSKDATIPSKQPTNRRYAGVWIFLIIFLTLGAILGGVLGGLLHRKRSGSSSGSSSSYNSTTSYSPPDFLALTAAECDQVTFVIYQKNNTGLYLRGNMKTGNYNRTSSPVIPEQQLHVAELSFPATGTDITAICQQGNSTSVSLYLYYVSGTAKTGKYNILEAAINFPDPSMATQYLIPDITSVVTNITEVPSITSVLLPPDGIHLYYLKPLSQTYSSQRGIYETFRKNSTGWSPPTYLSNAIASTRSASITACAVNISSAPAEIHLLFLNTENKLARRKWNENGWDTDNSIIYGQPTPSSYTQSLYSLPGMSSIVQSVNPTMLRLYYIDLYHVYKVSISPDTDTYIDKGAVNSPSYNLYQSVTQTPGLIAATSSNSTSDMAQVFFVRSKYRGSQYSWNAAILNATAPVDGDTWSISTLGQDPNAPPDSTMQMPT